MGCRYHSFPPSNRDVAWNAPNIVGIGEVGRWEVGYCRLSSVVMN